ncbi:MAG: adenylate kinase [Candidatus Paceibacteria bacterium]|jgi:adenylate kinase
MNTPKTLIVMGRSGSGKGTQINLLKNFYLGKNNEQDIFHFEPGNIFRKIIASGHYTGDKIKEATTAGKLVPDFITNGLFVSDMVHNLNSENQLLIFDGYPRSLNQAEMLDRTLKYFGRNSAVVIHVEVSEEEVRNRLTARGRHDDADMDALNTRIDFYNNSVLPVINFYKKSDAYTFINVNGIGDIDDIHTEVVKSFQN